jgi:Mechanosensitive ion channel, conserved TM helix
MDEVSLWIQTVSVAASRLLAQFVEFLPTLLGAIVVLALGWLAARMLRSAVRRFARWLNGFLDRRMGLERARGLRLSQAAVRLVGDATFWLIILLAVTLATRILGLIAFSAWLDKVVAYLPTLLAGGLIILAGVVISTLARDLTAAAIASARLAHAEVFARSVQAAILVMALVLGINQIGVDVTLLIALIAILAAAITGALALAFALGARNFVSNLIGAHYLQQLYAPGQRAIIGEIEGEIIELTPVGVVLATGKGRVTVPAKVFNEQPTTLLAQVGSDE